jgi:hypothetical protein
LFSDEKIDPLREGEERLRVRVRVNERDSFMQAGGGGGWDLNKAEAVGNSLFPLIKMNSIINSCASTVTCKL